MVPWKYGFKGIKSIVKITFVEKQPNTTLDMISRSNEYGFYSNVNPAVDHPSWSQAKEGGSASSQNPKTLPFYLAIAEQVASLYQGMDLRKNLDYLRMQSLLPRPG